LGLQPDHEGQDAEVTGDYPVTVTEPSRGWVALKWRELWEYRELLYFFIWRDIKVRYRQTVLGAAWVIIQPFFTMRCLASSSVDWLRSPPMVPLPDFQLRSAAPLDLLRQRDEAGIEQLGGQREPDYQGVFSPAGGAAV